MTYSNGSFNPNPLANPFNTRLGYSNYSLNPNGLSYSENAFNSGNKSLPEPKMLGDMNNELHTPTQDIPFRLADYQTMIDDYSRNKTWDNRLIYNIDSLNNLDCTGLLSRKDLEYWNKANIESQKLSNNMTDEQKQMMEEINKLFPPSKLELEE